MRITLVSSPYDLGHRDIGMGAGPTRLVKDGAEQVLRDAGHDVTVVTVNATDAPAHEIGATFLVNRLIADAVRAAVASGRFPIVLGGNCNVCLGAIGGLGLPELAVAWFDAHGDYHSPNTTGSGFFDGMALHIATGDSWGKLASTIPGFRPVAPRNVILTGVRDLDAEEEDLLDDSAVAVCDDAALREGGVRAALAPFLDAVASRTRDLYLHVDPDVLDPTVAAINTFQPGGGLRLEELREALDMIGDRFQVRAAAVASYSPAVDRGGTGLQAGLEVLQAFGDIGWGP